MTLEEIKERHLDRATANGIRWAINMADAGLHEKALKRADELSRDALQDYVREIEGARKP